MREADKHIEARLSAARHRLVVQRFVVVSAWSAVSLALSSTILLFALAQGWRGPMVYWITYLVISTWLVLSLWSFFGSIWHYRHDEQMAKLIESRDGRLQDALLASVDYQAGKKIGAQDLSEALYLQIAQLLNETQLSQWFPWSALKRAMSIAGCTALITLAWWIAQAEQLTAAYHALSKSPELITHQRSLTPLIGDIKLLLNPPAYTQEPPKVLDFGSGDFEALTGTQVKLDAILTRPAQKVDILWLPPQETQATTELPPPTPVTLEGRSIHATFEVKIPCAWRIRLTDLEGVEWIETVSRQVLIRPDLPPKVKIVTPINHQEVDPRQSIEVKLSAQDDFGLTQGELFLALSSAMSHPETLPLNAISTRQWNGNERLDLQMIEAQGGDTLALWAVVTDNRVSTEGPQQTQSEVIYLKVSGVADQHHALLDQLREHMEAQLTSLADRLNLTFDLLTDRKDALLSAQEHESLLTAWIEQRTITEALMARLSELVTEKMAIDELTPKEIYLAFVNRLERYEAASREEGRAVSKLTSLHYAQSALTIAKLDVSQSSLVEEIEATIILIEAMLARLALDEMAALAQELKDRRNQLRAMMEEFKQNPSEQLKARIKRELERFKRKMQAMREAMERLQKKLPKEFLNLDGLKSDELVDSLEQTSAQIDSIEKMIEEGRMEEALKTLEEMSQALDAMSDQLQKDQQELHEQTNPELDKALSELMDQTRDLMKAQAEVSRDAQGQQEAMDRAQQEMLEREEDGLIQEIKERLERLKKLSSSLSSQVEGEGYMLRLYEEGNKAVNDLDRGLEQALLPEALDAAERAESSFEGLKRSARSRAMYGRNQAQDQKIQNDANEAKQLSTELLNRLEQLKNELEQAAQEAQRNTQEQQAQAQAQRDQRQGQQQGQQGQTSPQQGQGATPNGLGAQAGQGSQASSQGERPSLSQRQRQITQGVQSLRERLEAKRDKTPSLHQVPNEPFDQAMEGSREAERELQQQPGRGRPGQQRVEDALGQIMEGLKQSKSPSPSPGQQQQGQSSGQQGHGGKEHSSERVEIPQAGERKEDSLRKDLVEAMKDRPAQGYDEQVKAYYESLVR